MYKLQNGWTKESMKAKIKEMNLGTKSIKRETDIRCMYRGEDGNACAVGCFIPNDQYNEAMDSGGSAKVLIRNYPHLANLMPLEVDGLISMQLVHDNASTYENVHNLLFNFIDSQCEEEV